MGNKWSKKVDGVTVIKHNFYKFDSLTGKYKTIKKNGTVYISAQEMGYTRYELTKKNSVERIVFDVDTSEANLTELFNKDLDDRIIFGIATNTFKPRIEGHY